MTRGRGRSDTAKTALGKLETLPLFVTRVLDTSVARHPAMHIKVSYLLAVMAVAYIQIVGQVAGQCTTKRCHDEIKGVVSLFSRLYDSAEKQQNQLAKLEETVLSLKEEVEKLHVCTYNCFVFVLLTDFRVCCSELCSVMFR